MGLKMEAATVEVPIQTTVHTTHTVQVNYAGLQMEHGTILLRATDVSRFPLRSSGECECLDQELHIHLSVSLDSTT